MDRSIQRTGLLNWIILLTAAVVSLAVARYADSAAGEAAGILLGFGFLAAMMSYFQMRLEERERLEKLDYEELSKASGSKSIFTAPEADVFPAKRSREQFERFFIPVFTVLLFSLQMFAAYRLWTGLAEATAPQPGRMAVAMALFGLNALILFLLGKYCASVARLQNQRLLRPGAGYLLLGAYVSFAVTAVLAGAQAGFPQLDVYLAGALSILIGLIAVETVLNLTLEIYRPRVKGRPGRLLYESRVVGVLGEPEALVSTAAHALDYQFGFKVSETWFYKFLQRAFGWLILLQAGVLLLSTTIVFIDPGEQGLLERFGRPLPNRPILEPGLHLKLPWPMDKLQRFPTRQLQTFNIGFVPHEDEGHERSVLWTVSHYEQEFNMLVASRDVEAAARSEDPNITPAPPVNMLVVSIPVQYQIRDVRAWAYHHVNASELLERLATREVVRYLVSVDLHDIMSTARLEAAQDLRKHIQSRADELALGVDIVFVGLQDIHPPVAVADAYEAVPSAQQEIEAQILRAEGYHARTVPEAEAEAVRLVREAEIYQINKMAGAAAQAARFTNQMTAFAAAPRVYPERMRLQTIARATAGLPKTVLGVTNSHEVFQFNFEEVLIPGLLDIEVPPPRR
jgi:modulator of FtsH protease HflK